MADVGKKSLDRHLAGSSAEPEAKHAQNGRQPIDEKYWTAKEWAMRTRVPYRTILSATARGELAAVRPSGKAHGIILISESSWEAWLDHSRLRVRVPTRVPTRVSLSRPNGRDGSLHDLALS
ncbi:MAG: hypothetical protein WBM00_01180 [Solirubrobacterales bacterium]